MDLFIQIAAVVAMSAVSFGTGIVCWFVIFRSSPPSLLRRIRAVMIGFAGFGVLFVAFVGMTRFIFDGEAVQHDSEQRTWLVLGPCFVAAVSFAQILALHWRVRRLDHAA